MKYRLWSTGILLLALCLHGHAQSVYAYVLNINNQTNLPLFVASSNFSGMTQWISQNRVLSNTIRPNSNNNFPIVYQSLDPSVSGRTVLVVNCSPGQNFLVLTTQVTNEIPYLNVSEVRVGPGAKQCITLNRFGRIDYTNLVASLVIRRINNINTSNTTRTPNLIPRGKTIQDRNNTVSPTLNR